MILHQAGVTPAFKLHLVRTIVQEGLARQSISSLRSADGAEQQVKSVVGTLCMEVTEVLTLHISCLRSFGRSFSTGSPSKSKLHSSLVCSTATSTSREWPHHILCRVTQCLSPYETQSSVAFMNLSAGVKLYCRGKHCPHIRSPPFQCPPVVVFQ